MKNRILIALGLSLLTFINSSCTTIGDGIYTTFIDRYTGQQILEMEGNVRIFLENILEAPYNYLMTGYVRTLIRLQPRRTRLCTHSYYVITNINSGEFNTLSYVGTRLAFRSQGAWSLNSDNDMASILSYRSGSRRWDVQRIDVEIDTAATVKNILEMMDSGVTFYYRAHVRPRPGVVNCNVALWNTLARRQPDDLCLKTYD